MGNWIPNNDELLTVSRLPEKWNEKSRKSPTKLTKTRRTCPESKTSSTNCKLRSRPTSDKPKKLKKLPTKTCPSTERSNTNWMKLKNELIWLNPLLTRCDLRPEILSFKF